MNRTTFPELEAVASAVAEQRPVAVVTTFSTLTRVVPDSGSWSRTTG